MEKSALNDIWHLIIVWENIGHGIEVFADEYGRRSEQCLTLLQKIDDDRSLIWLIKIEQTNQYFNLFSRHTLRRRNHDKKSNIFENEPKIGGPIMIWYHLKQEMYKQCFNIYWYIFLKISCISPQSKGINKITIFLKLVMFLCHNNIFNLKFASYFYYLHKNEIN